ncbi:MAG: NAD(P)/FAD-dependent oxidoreductase [Xanthobacteraceae bacterium]
MWQCDVAIVGGGLAGSLAAAMLGRTGASTVLIDPHPVYPDDFRCEKLDGFQISVLEKTGLADLILPATTHDREVWLARFGYLMDCRPSDQHGIFYNDLVNTVRATIPPPVRRIVAKAVDLSTSDDRQSVTLSTGDTVSARLIVLATGLSVSLRDKLGIARTVTSPCHSITAGFNLSPVGRAAFPFRALTYHPERARDGISYLTVFPIGDILRANLMTYRTMDDPWLRQLRQRPVPALEAVMPSLRRMIGDFAVSGPVRIRPTDLYITSGHRQAGVVLVGDAFASPCPASGTGCGKVLTDIERLCNVHIPRWLTSDGLDAGKIAAFYDDPVKVENDRRSMAKAYHLRKTSIDPGLPWRTERVGRFVLCYGIGRLRRSRAWLSAHVRPAAPQSPA